MNHIELGIKGEEMAVDHLLSSGYLIRERNYRFGRLELDIICEHEHQLIIVEVKTRNSKALGEPYSAVSKSKQRQIIRATNNYILENDVEKEIRFDVISIISNSNYENIEHIESAFYALI
jgi:putative endonuclease